MTTRREMAATTTATDRSGVTTTLEDLIELNVDAKQGFERAADLLEPEEQLAARFRRIGSERASMAAELRSMGSKYGVEDVAGSVAADLHRAWMGLKDAVLDDPHAVLATVEEAEDRAIETYEQALDRNLPDEVGRLVRKQFVEVKEGHDVVRDLRDAYA